MKNRRFDENCKLQSTASVCKWTRPQLKLRGILFYLLIFGFGLVVGVISSFSFETLPNYMSIVNLIPVHDLKLSSTTSCTTSLPPESPHPPPDRPLSLLSPPPPLSGDEIREDGLMGLQQFMEPTSLMHRMDDKELLWRASMVPRISEFPCKRTPKVAFMFLTRGELPLSPLWEKFFKGYEGLYSIYVHPHPHFNGSAPQNSVFYRRRIPSKEANWGKFNVFEAERRLLANALLDFSNQYFVLLSESCAPLYNFTTIYAYLTNTSHTFVASADEPGPGARGRYNERMAPLIKLEQWRKGGQWFEMDREMAVEVVADGTYLPAFSRYCKSRCVVDEHYLPTFTHIKFGRKNANRSVTYTDWSRHGSHPAQFGEKQVNKDRLMEMKNGTECEYNGQRTRVCFLFARKFAPSSLGKLLALADEVLGIH